MVSGYSLPKELMFLTWSVNDGLIQIMDIKKYFFILFFSITANPAVAIFPQVSVQDSQWSQQAVKLDAVKAIANHQLFLYSSGGFVCSPKTNSHHTNYIKLLPIKMLACGCTIFNIEQQQYARSFNTLILDYIAKHPNALKQQQEMSKDPLFQLISKTISNSKKMSSTPDIHTQ